MKKKEYLNEEEYQKETIKLKKMAKIFLIVGIIILVIAIILTVFGGFGFSNTISEAFGNDALNTDRMGNFTGSALGSIGLFIVSSITYMISFSLIVIGVIMAFMANGRKITAYATQQVMPLEQEKIEKMAPTIGNAGETIAENVTRGIKNGLKDEEK